MGNKIEHEKGIETYMNIYYCGNEYIDLTPFTNDKVKYEDGVAKLKHPPLEWEYYLYQSLNENAQIKNIIAMIIHNCEIQKTDKANNVIVCVLDGVNDPRLQVLMRELCEIKNSNMLPSVVFVFKQILNKTPCDIIMENKIRYSDLKMISQIQHNKTNLTQKLYELCSYYNQLGDEFSVNGEEVRVATSIFSSYFNIMFIGAPGSGKSTIINKFLGQQRSLIRKGMSITTKINKYHHKEYPFLLFDTPGFENMETKKQLIDLIKNHHIKSEQKNYDSVHLILYVVNAEGRFFTQEDIPFLKSLLEYKVPIIFLINYCKNDNIEIDKVKTLKSILTNNNISIPHIIPMNLVSSLRGYPELFKLLYNIFEKKKIKQVDEIRNKLEQGDTQDVIDNYLKPSSFFNNINNSSHILNRINNKSNDEISSFTKLKFAGYLLFLRPSFNSSAIQLFPKINAHYSIKLTNQQIQELLNEWNIEQIIENIEQDDINGFGSMIDLYNYVQRIHGYESMDQELFNIVYEQASPFLTNRFLDWFSQVVGFKKYAIGYAMLGFRIKKYCQEKSNTKGFTEIIMQGIENYHQAIDLFHLLSTDKRFETINSNLKKNI